MNRLVKKSALVTGIACLLLAGMGGAWAGDDHKYRKHGYGKHHGHHYHQPYNNKRHYRRYDSDDDEKLIYGLLVGGLFGYVIGNANQVDYSNSYYSAPPVTSYPQTAPVSSYTQSVPATSCLQEREYQMKVIVGGKEADAYGTACLQPDGSWYRGPARVVSR